MLGKRLESIKFDSIYCSTSGRARTTLSIAIKDSNAEYLDSLREISLGTWEGREQSEIEKENPVQFDNFWHHPENFSVDGGETFFDIYKRTGEVLRLLAHARGLQGRPEQELDGDPHDGQRLLPVSKAGRRTVLRSRGALKSQHESVLLPSMAGSSSNLSLKV